MRGEKGNGNREFSARGALSVNWDLSFFKNHLKKYGGFQGGNSCWVAFRFQRKYECGSRGCFAHLGQN